MGVEWIPVTIPGLLELDFVPSVQSRGISLCQGKLIPNS